ncbi:32076_t:CDS:2, partial [Gigaspora margarita]
MSNSQIKTSHSNKKSKTCTYVKLANLLKICHAVILDHIWKFTRSAATVAQQFKRLSRADLQHYLRHKSHEKYFNNS